MKNAPSPTIPATPKAKLVIVKALGQANKVRLFSAIDGEAAEAGDLRTGATRSIQFALAKGMAEGAVKGKAQGVGKTPSAKIKDSPTCDTNSRYTTFTEEKTDNLEEKMSERPVE